MRSRLLLPLLLALLPAAPANAAPETIQGETAGVIQISCWAPYNCMVSPLSPRWAACHREHSSVSGTNNAPTACWADVWGSVGPNAVSNGCNYLTGAATITFFSTAGGTWSVPVDVGPAHTGHAGFRGRLVSGSTVVYVEGSWTNYCANGWRGQFQVNYTIVRT